MFRKQTTTHIVLITTIHTLLIFGFVACIQKKPKEIMGYAPVYGTLSEMQTIQSEPSREIKNAGKIYQYLSYTFQIENGEGIHIFNCSDPSIPLRVGFIKVRGCSEISIRNGILYTDNFQDLVGINISNLNSVNVASRVEKVFPPTTQNYPPVAGVYFECPDANEGAVIGWTEKLLIDPKCSR